MDTGSDVDPAPDRARRPALTPAAQDHLKAIWSAGEWVDSPVTTTLLAERLGVAPSTVSEQVRRLVDAGLVAHRPYRPIALTGAGEAQALRMVRRHRLIETYLVAELGYSWDEVHDEAEALEHAVSDLMVERIDARLGRPRSDPHGDPIPAADGAVARPDARPLARLGVGEGGVVARVDDRDADLLRWCEAVGLRPGVAVTVLGPAGGGATAARLEGAPGDDGAQGGAAAAAVEVPAAAAAAVQVAPPA